VGVGLWVWLGVGVDGRGGGGVVCVCRLLHIFLMLVCCAVLACYLLSTYTYSSVRWHRNSIRLSWNTLQQHPRVTDFYPQVFISPSLSTLSLSLFSLFLSLLSLSLSLCVCLHSSKYPLTLYPLMRISLPYMVSTQLDGVDAS